MDPALAPAVTALRAGGLIAYPTESVYGLGCLPEAAALARLRALKDRETDSGLILIGASLQQLRPFLGAVPEEVLERVEASWPAALTWVLPAREGLDPALTGGRGTIAVRVPDHALARALCEAVGSPITSTSANPRGGEPARDAATVRALLGDAVDAVVDAPTGGRSMPSEIRDGLSGQVLRPGEGA